MLLPPRFTLFPYTTLFRSIVRELLLGARRFGEIRGALEGLSANILTQRLEGLEKAGILRRRQLPSPANARVYELDRKSTRLNSSHVRISYAVFCLKKKTQK